MHREIKCKLFHTVYSTHGSGATTERMSLFVVFPCEIKSLVDCVDFGSLDGLERESTSGCFELLPVGRHLDISLSKHAM